jgi:hypothetical protein
MSKVFGRGFDVSLYETQASLRRKNIAYIERNAMHSFLFHTCDILVAHVELAPFVVAKKEGSSLR